MDFFLDSYEDCRNAFKTLARKAIQTFPHSKRSKIRVGGKGGVIDAILIQAKKKRSRKLILLSSGVHGVEGFAGSAIQRRMLSSCIEGTLEFPCDVLMIHGINPYGFRHWRRVNENNVDLNRNFFLKREKLPKKEKNKGYRKLASFFSPGFPFTFWRFEFFFFLLRFSGILIRFGARKFTDSAVNGQFEYRRGIYYGGRKPERVVRCLKLFLKEIVADYHDVLFLDIHTGYGEQNGLILIQNAALGSSEDRNIQKIAADLPLLRPESSENFYKTAGDFTDFLGRLFPDRDDFYPMTLELGTTGNMRAWGALTSSFIVVAENRIHHRGAWFPSARKEIREKFLRLFYPASLEWKQSALEKSLNVCKTLFERFDSV